MSASLVEMIAAIVISGILLAGAVTPTAAVLVTYQKMQAAAQTATTHATAAVRVEQVGGQIWRDVTPPTGHGTLDTATATVLNVGNWEVRRSSTRIEHERSGVTGVLAQNVGSFQFEYLLDDGTWTASTLDSATRDELVALRATWTDTATGASYAARAVPPDRAFAAGSIALEAPDDSQAYARANYERNITLPIAGW